MRCSPALPTSSTVSGILQLNRRSTVDSGSRFRCSNHCGRQPHVPRPGENCLKGPVTRERGSHTCCSLRPVTTAWGLLLGDDLHYGVFDWRRVAAGGDRALTSRWRTPQSFDRGSRARRRLRHRSAGLPAGRAVRRKGRRHHHQRGRCRGSNVRAAERGLSDQASFELRDGTDNGFESESFDRVWVLESSHLMPGREQLVSECARVLTPGGRMALCDIIRQREIPFGELRARRRIRHPARGFRRGTHGALGGLRRVRRTPLAWWSTVEDLTERRCRLSTAGAQTRRCTRRSRGLGTRASTTSCGAPTSWSRCGGTGPWATVCSPLKSRP